MAKLRLIRTKKAKIPRLHMNGLSDRFWEEVGKIVEGSILDNLRSQTAADGGPIKKNADSTRAQKLRKGTGLRSLIDEQHRFVQGSGGSWKVTKKRSDGLGITVGPSTAELKKLVQYVARLGYTGYLGVSKEGVSAIKAALRNEIRRQFRKANR